MAAWPGSFVKPDGSRFEIDPVPLEVARRQASWMRPGTILEVDMETVLAQRLQGYGSRVVRRQVLCHRLKPDIVAVDGPIVTIVELKRWSADKGALNQLTRYVAHAIQHAVDDDTPTRVYGVLAAPFLDPELVLPAWCAWMPLVITEPGRN